MVFAEILKKVIKQKSEENINYILEKYLLKREILKGIESQYKKEKQENDHLKNIIANLEEKLNQSNFNNPNSIIENHKSELVQGSLEQLSLLKNSKIYSGQNYDIIEPISMKNGDKKKMDEYYQIRVYFEKDEIQNCLDKYEPLSPYTDFLDKGKFRVKNLLIDLDLNIDEDCLKNILKQELPLGFICGICSGKNGQKNNLLRFFRDFLSFKGHISRYHEKNIKYSIINFGTMEEYVVVRISKNGKSFLIRITDLNDEDRQEFLFR